MELAIVIASCVLALAWLPIALRFRRGWVNRRNPVSLAICAAACLFAYTNILFALAVADQTTWRFFAIATHAFDLVVVTNFYIAFRWSDRKFVDERAARRDYTVPPMNAGSTPRNP